MYLGAFLMQAINLRVHPVELFALLPFDLVDFLFHNRIDVEVGDKRPLRLGQLAELCLPKLVELPFVVEQVTVEATYWPLGLVPLHNHA
jgi:hypothetical protein